jgi:hypothetical protein
MCQLAIDGQFSQYSSLAIPTEISALFGGATPFIVAIPLCLAACLAAMFSNSATPSTTSRKEVLPEPSQNEKDLSDKLTAATKELDQLKDLQRSSMLELEQSQSENLKQLQDSAIAIRELQNALATANKEVAKQQSTDSTESQRLASDAEIVNLLSLLQDKGRFVDFVMDDISSVQDAAIGAAARVVHQGCKAVFDQYFTVEPIHLGNEGQAVDVDQSPQAPMVRIIGSSKPSNTSATTSRPKGRLLHKGWQISDVRLPRLQSTDQKIRPLVVTPAEIEVL